MTLRPSGTEPPGTMCLLHYAHDLAGPQCYAFCSTRQKALAWSYSRHAGELSVWQHRWRHHGPEVHDLAAPLGGHFHPGADPPLVDLELAASHGSDLRGSSSATSVLIDTPALRAKSVLVFVQFIVL